jgi:hypothetical protein
MKISSKNVSSSNTSLVSNSNKNQTPSGNLAKSINNRNSAVKMKKSNMSIKTNNNGNQKNKSVLEIQQSNKKTKINVNKSEEEKSNLSRSINNTITGSFVKNNLNNLTNLNSSLKEKEKDKLYSALKPLVINSSKPWRRNQSEEKGNLNNLNYSTIPLHSTDQLITSSTSSPVKLKFLTHRCNHEHLLLK